ncbi:MAG: hypothetical protein KAT68_00285 [Bacteroidales bacterium]|nr:hypothetical protein [Bacteroidales bacterium]
MLEHQKLILKNIINNKNLFEKEILKSKKWLTNYEQHLLLNWINKEYGNIYPELIFRTFNDVS